MNETQEAGSYNVAKEQSHVGSLTARSWFQLKRHQQFRCAHKAAFVLDTSYPAVDADVPEDLDRYYVLIVSTGVALWIVLLVQ